MFTINYLIIDKINVDRFLKCIFIDIQWKAKASDLKAQKAWTLGDTTWGIRLQILPTCYKHNTFYSEKLLWWLCVFWLSVFWHSKIKEILLTWYLNDLLSIFLSTSYHKIIEEWFLYSSTHLNIVVWQVKLAILNEESSTIDINDYRQNLYIIL